ncbi:MAG: T9SS type A sorting domain-containing protein [Saprospiraceae bacterium]|nr:T9SS type A sorting domain-containing protein [Saprospiraceae bacterium]
MRKFLFHTLLTFSICSAYSQNILINDQGFPNEPSIMMDPLHPNVIIAAANINQYYISLDTGRTWSVRTLQSSHGVWGDPAIAVDINSNFYFFHLSNPSSGNWIDRIVCQKTTDNGQTWNDGSYTGLNGTKAQDKQWFAIDRTDNTIYLTWTQFDVYGSKNPQDSSAILFSKSTDAGETWSQAVRINKISGDCVDSDNTVEGAVPAVGPNGEVYVSWAGPEGIVFDRSLDKGLTWLDSDIPVDPMPTGWDYTISGIYRANGLPVTTCDLSNSSYRGTIYINWSDQRNGSNDTDIFLAKSTDGGNTWSAPIRVNDDAPGKQQFFTWMTIDQTNGYLYFVFYDRRHHDDDSTDVYLALSKDGGQTFNNRRISESPFKPNAGVFFGDYTNITAHNGIVRPIWTRFQKGKLSIWTHLANGQDFTTAIAPESNSSLSLDFESYPNPSSDEIYVSYKLHTRSVVSLSLLDMNGHIIKRIIAEEKKGYGKYVEKIEPSKLNIPAGVYILQLEVDNTVTTVKQVIVRE